MNEQFFQYDFISFGWENVYCQYPDQMISE